MTVSKTLSARTALICGPYLSGKSSLFEALLAEAGALPKPAAAQNTLNLADSTPEARAHGMSTEMNIASVDYLGESWSFVDCPGSIELTQDMRGALAVADIAVVVVEPDADKALILASQIKLLEAASVPHILFINKFDKKNVSARALMQAFQEVSEKPLVLREIPIHEGDVVTGHVDLVSERAFHWEENKPSSLISLPDVLLDREHDSGAEIQPQYWYDFQPHSGPVRSAGPGKGRVSGSALLALHAENLESDILPELRMLMRSVIGYHLGEKPLASLKLFNA